MVSLCRDIGYHPSCHVVQEGIQRGCFSVRWAGFDGKFRRREGGGNSLQYTVNSGDRLTEDFDSYTTHNTNDTNGADGTDDTGGWHVMEV